jgi:hypothetical protein
VNPRNPNRRILGTSVWYGKVRVPLYESFPEHSTNLWNMLQKRGNGCIISNARLAQPDDKTYVVKNVACMPRKIKEYYS